MNQPVSAILVEVHLPESHPGSLHTTNVNIAQQGKHHLSPARIRALNEKFQRVLDPRLKTSLPGQWKCLAFLVEVYRIAMGLGFLGC